MNEVSKLFAEDDRRILKGWELDEQEELEWEKDNHNSILDTFDSVLNQDGTALHTKYMNTKTDLDEQQLADDIYDYWQGRAKFPEKKYYVKFISGRGNLGYLNYSIYTGRTSVFAKQNRENIRTIFTKEQIKAIDERYLPFAVPVEDEKKAE